MTCGKIFNPKVSDMTCRKIFNPNVPDTTCGKILTSKYLTWPAERCLTPKFLTWPVERCLTPKFLTWPAERCLTPMFLTCPVERCLTPTFLTRHVKRCLAPNFLANLFEVFVPNVLDTTCPRKPRRLCWQKTICVKPYTKCYESVVGNCVILAKLGLILLSLVIRSNSYSKKNGSFVPQSVREVWKKLGERPF